MLNSFCWNSGNFFVVGQNAMLAHSVVILLQGILPLHPLQFFDSLYAFVFRMHHHLFGSGIVFWELSV